MKNTSLIYKNIFLYRILMQCLYLGKYYNRFIPILSKIDANTGSVLELCFGDLVIAEHCKKNGINWTGFDINKSFVLSAKKRGFNAIENDIMVSHKFPETSLLIIVGSLYHFHNEMEQLFDKILKSSNHIIISEPIQNLSSMPGLIGFIAKRAANAGKGEESFRFNKKSLIDSIDYILKKKGNYTTTILNESRDLVLEIKLSQS